MPQALRAGLIKLAKYGLPLGISALLLWWVFKDQDLAVIAKGFREAEYSWIVLSVLISILTNYLRAIRWNLLMEPLGYSLSGFRTFLALMVGYFSNIFVPRLGEITRCGILYRTDRVPVAQSFGTVVVERVIDVVSLLIVIGLSLLVEFDKLYGFVAPYFADKLQLLKNPLFLTLAGIAALVLLIGAWLFFKLFKKKLLQYTLIQKVYALFQQIVEGLLSIKDLKHPILFILTTIAIWVLYYFMAYVIVFSLEATSHLSWLAGVSILVMGAIGMAAPVQGGIGAYHILVSSVLVLYGVAKEDGLVYATLIHSSQALTLLVLGAISFFISLIIENKNTKTATS
ncbi:lysylphosphatidylglycerol synthase transmembrane domain-containing protein [Cytophagales bacterium LB-30]|uniref:Lysylphosphatidylglycerol synthase transmembrane domain-containing protein n=1 Tax=Shiella aurantiaca TaxID=3058365 RepID=A0ABT8F5I6_9BACT|nr:lysylphosphatidylglycerol synthase transmembrane domain-containing protein [Shiella aurantiaca]MDN4165721.1 lysylphosphatidylglycerol synthase transmembrane domain-containing protein [Shiella aurantiaca]